MKNRILTTLLLYGIIQLALCQQDLSLEQAIEKALINNFSINISKIEVEQAQSRNTKGNAGMLPSVDLLIGQQQTLQEQNNPNSVLQGQIFTSTTSPTLELNWNLFNGFKAQANKSKLEKIEVMSQNNAELVLQNTLHAVTLAYFKCKAEAHKLQALENTLLQSRLNTHRTKKKADLGVISSFDAYQDYNNYLSDSSNYIQQIQVLESTKRTLNYLLVDSVDYMVNNLPTLEESLSLEELLKTQYDIPSIKVQIINQEILEQNRKIATSSRYPSLGMRVGSSFSSTYVQTVQFNVRPAPSWQSYVNFSLNFNLFNGGKTKIAIETASQDIEIQTLKIDDAVNSIKTDIKNTYYLFSSQQSVLAIEQEKLTNSKKLLGQAQRKYELGTLNSFDFREIQLNHTLNELNLYNLRFGLISSYLELLKLSGQLNAQNIIQL